MSQPYSTSTLRSSVYAETLQRLVDDEVVQRMAAEIRIHHEPREKFAHDSGGPTHEFMGRANQGYKMLGGKDEGPLHLGGIAEAVLRLAYELPVARYTVRFTTEPLIDIGVWKTRAVTKTELAMRIRNLVCVAHDLDRSDVRVELAGRVGFAKRAEGGDELVSFTITEEKETKA